MLKNKIYKHFFKEFFKIFLLITLSLSILIWMTQAARLLEIVTEYGNSISIYSKYLLLSYPKILVNIYLICFAVSIFFLINKLESDKELNIFWISGISKNNVIKKILFLTTICLIFFLILSIYLAPFSSLKGRQILSESKFTMVNSLVKKNNFNSPLKGLTIFVEKNDNRGNLENIFIYEKNRTIIAKKGRVISDDSKNYLELFDGSSQEKVKEKINIINFNTTTFDFSNYKTLNVSHPKFSERGIYWLFENYNNKKIIKLNEIREEVNKRLIKPFFIFVLSILSCYILYSNNNKKKFKRYRYSIYFLTFSSIFFNEALLGYSGKNFIFTISYIIIIFLIFCFLLLLLKNMIKNEMK